MSLDDSGSLHMEVFPCTPKVYFYIGDNDSDEEDEGLECDISPFSTPRVPPLTHIWSDIDTCEEGQEVPLDLTMKMLRILQGLVKTPQETRASLAHYNTYMKQRVAQVSIALQEYGERLCIRVGAILERSEAEDLSAMKEEIKQIKEQIQNAKRMSSHKDHRTHKAYRFLARNTQVERRQYDRAYDFPVRCLHFQKDK